MSELDTIVLKNPTSEDFTHNWNGEPYTIPAGEAKAFAQYVGYHLAKHLATQMIQKGITKEQKADENHIKNLVIYDNPELRINLYKILGDKDLVQNCITHYPYKGFIGDMDIYKKYVEKAEGKDKKEEEKETPAPSASAPSTPSSAPAVPQNEGGGEAKSQGDSGSGNTPPSAAPVS